jgi:ABC-type antimicrobial peptide transport system permease subunit
VLGGIALGTLAALGLARFMGALLYGVRPSDPTTYAATALLLLGTALLAAWLPARRAARVDPTEALRCR